MQTKDMRINDLRLTFIFTETILDPPLIGGVAMPLARFVTEHGYPDVIDAARNGRAPLQLELPWPYSPGQHFLDLRPHDRMSRDASGNLCFEKLAPLRLGKLVKKIRAVLPQEFAQSSRARLGIEGYYYPHGIGLLITAILEGEFDITKTGDLGLETAVWRRLPAVMAGNRLPQNSSSGSSSLQPWRSIACASSASARESTACVAACSRSPPSCVATTSIEIDLLSRQRGPSPAQRTADWVHGWRGHQAPQLVAGSTKLLISRRMAWPGNVLYGLNEGGQCGSRGNFFRRRLRCTVSVVITAISVLAHSRLRAS